MRRCSNDNCGWPEEGGYENPTGPTEDGCGCWCVLAVFVLGLLIGGC